MNDLITLKEVVLFLTDIDSPLGDLCHSILSDKSFPYHDIDEAWEYLNNMKRKSGKDIDEPIRRLKTVYRTIAKS